MAGIYIHIPFCKQACYYCDFHFSTNLKTRSEMVKAISAELVKRQKYLSGQPIESIYFGGGTPSILNNSEIEILLNCIRENFSVGDPEVTLEANPDDLDEVVLDGFLRAGINRLSIGIQTFNEDRLNFLNRSHNSAQAEHSFELARATGFENISADLIFAIPPERDSLKRFESDLKRLLQYNPEHVSLYNLTIEEKTVFGNWYSKNRFIPVSNESSAEQYELAIHLLSGAGYDHYEISNFSKAENVSQHNSSYWKSANYLGVGPGAHSFNGKSRTINVSNNSKYLDGIKNGDYASDTEVLNPAQKLNEYILTRTRTKWGLDLKLIQENWGIDMFKQHESMLSSLVSDGKASIESGVFRLTSRGFSIADEVALKLFSEE